MKTTIKPAQIAKKRWSKTTATTSKPVKAQRNKTKPLDPVSPLSIDYSHRSFVCSGGHDVAGFYETVDHTGLRARSVLSLIKGSIGRSNDDTYYSLCTIKMDVADIGAFVSAFKEASEKHYQDQLKSDNQATCIDYAPLPIDPRVFDALDQAVLRAHGCLSLLCDYFAEDDLSISNNEQITCAINLACIEINGIRAILRDYRKAKNLQA